MKQINKRDKIFRKILNDFSFIRTKRIRSQEAWILILSVFLVGHVTPSPPLIPSVKEWGGGKKRVGEDKTLPKVLSMLE